MATKRPKMKTMRPSKRPVSTATGRKAARAKGAAVKTTERSARPAVEAPKAPAPPPPIEKKPGTLPVPSATFFF